MFTALIILHVLVAFIMVGVILLQSGKGAEIGAAFGGSSQTVFGARGANTSPRCRWRSCPNSGTTPRPSAWTNRLRPLRRRLRRLRIPRRQLNPPPHQRPLPQPQLIRPIHLPHLPQPIHNDSLYLLMRFALHSRRG